MKFIASYESGSEAETEELVKPRKLKSYSAEFKLKWSSVQKKTPITQRRRNSGSIESESRIGFEEILKNRLDLYYLAAKNTKDELEVEYWVRQTLFMEEDFNKPVEQYYRNNQSKLDNLINSFENGGKGQQ
uniref:Uncharacterized protein n=1 Tax=Ditylenchus dipsaci TaxID=166011 RepID=A0A915DN99_9BILA